MLSGLAMFGNGISMSLLALGIGFIVFDIAGRQKNLLKYLGYSIGVVIMVFSIVVLANTLIASANIAKRLNIGGMMPPPQQKAIQPHMPMMQPQDQTQAK